ncbi:MAG: hypothetical protein R3308_07420 [Thiohalobacterales bacterium]|nr:hypothetical protein [Thiohalobacterales bacterium]
MKYKTHTVIAAILAILLLAAATALSAEESETDIMRDGRITLTLREVSLAEVMEMLSRAGKVNILLAEDVQGRVSVNLFDVSLDQAVRSIATSAGYAVERRGGSYFIVDRDEAGKAAPGGPTRVRTFKVQ